MNTEQSFQTLFNQMKAPLIEQIQRKDWRNALEIVTGLCEAAATPPKEAEGESLEDWQSLFDRRAEQELGATYHEGSAKDRFISLIRYGYDVAKKEQLHGESLSPTVSYWTKETIQGESLSLEEIENLACVAAGKQFNLSSQEVKEWARQHVSDFMFAWIKGYIAATAPLLTRIKQLQEELALRPQQPTK